MVIRGGPFPDADPVPLREALVASWDALRLAWEVDRTGLLLLIAVNGATTAADVAVLLSSRGAIDSVVEGDGRRAQTRRLLTLGALGLVSTVGKSLGNTLGTPVSQAVNRRTEGAILDVVAALDPCSAHGGG